jgi:CRISPR/Cas system-associated protein Cas5 (RAMP superfamily)
MFAKTIVDSDAFLDMPLSTQSLYFHLSMRADDDGFINNPKKIQRMIGAADDDLKILVTKKFIIPFESGIVVIKHWKIHNYIRNDRYKETVYKEEKQQLNEKENKAYTLSDTVGIPDGIPNDNQMETQVRLGKDSIGKDNIVNIEIKKKVSTELENEFEEIWSMYPKKQGKTNALKSYIKARKNGVDKETVWNGLGSYIDYIKASKTPTQYIKQGSTWFNQECWNDDYTIETKGGNSNDKVKYGDGSIYANLEC